MTQTIFIGNKSKGEGIEIGLQPAMIRTGWRMVEEPGKEPYALATTRIPVAFGRTSGTLDLHDDITQSINQLKTYFKQAKTAIRNGLVENQIYAHLPNHVIKDAVKTTEPTLCLIQSGKIELVGNNSTTPLGSKVTTTRAILEIEHIVTSERDIENSVIGSGINIHGGTLVIPSLQDEEDLEEHNYMSLGRISELQFRPANSGAENQTELYIGLLPAGHSHSFVAATTTKTYTITSPLNAIATYVEAFHNNSNGSITMNAYRGRFRILARVKTNIYQRLQVGVGTMSSVDYDTWDYIKLPPVYVNTNGRWKVIDFGEITLPPWGNNNAYNGSEYEGLTLFMENCVSGNFSRWILMPAQHMIHIKGAIFDYGFSGNLTLIQTTETGEVVVKNRINSLSTSIKALIQKSFTEWGMPPEGATLVIAMNNEDDADSTEGQANVTVKWYGRKYGL